MPLLHLKSCLGICLHGESAVLFQGVTPTQPPQPLPARRDTETLSLAVPGGFLKRLGDIPGDVVVFLPPCIQEDLMVPPACTKLCHREAVVLH